MGNRFDLDICIVGAGGHGRVVASQMLRSGYKNICFSDSLVAVGTEVAGCRVKFPDIQSITCQNILIAIGGNEKRKQLQEMAIDCGLNPISFIAEPDHCFHTPPVGDGSVVLFGARLNDKAEMGQGVIINTSSVVEHDVKVGDYSHVSPGAVLAGDCKIGKGCWIGANAAVVNGVSICSGVTVGAGSVVLNDIETPGVYVGSPVRLLK